MAQDLESYQHVDDLSGPELIKRLGHLRTNVKRAKSFFKNIDSALLYVPLDTIKLIIRWVNLWFPEEKNRLYRLRKDRPYRTELITENEQIDVWVICAYVKESKNSQLSSGVDLEPFIRQIREEGKYTKTLGNENIKLLASFFFDTMYQNHRDLFDHEEMNEIVKLFLCLEDESGSRYNIDAPGLRNEYERNEDFFVQEIAPLMIEALTGEKPMEEKAEAALPPPPVKEETLEPMAASPSAEVLQPSRAPQPILPFTRAHYTPPPPTEKKLLRSWQLPLSPARKLLSTTTLSFLPNQQASKPPPDLPASSEKKTSSRS